MHLQFEVVTTVWIRVTLELDHTRTTTFLSYSCNRLGELNNIVQNSQKSQFSQAFVCLVMLLMYSIFISYCFNVLHISNHKTQICSKCGSCHIFVPAKFSFPTSFPLKSDENWRFKSDENAFVGLGLLISMLYGSKFP